MLIEMECNVCGNHAICSDLIYTLCEECSNGLMVDYKNLMKKEAMNQWLL